MTRRQYLTLLTGLAVIMVMAALSVATSLLSARTSCERGNVTRAHLARPAPPADCSLFAPVQP